jgi:hypothetical protein
MRSRTDCEAEILAAYHAYREAEEAGDQAGADLEEIVMNELVEEYGRLPLQRRPTP